MDVTVITPESWHPNWPLQEVNVKLLGIGTLFQVKQCAMWVKYIGIRRTERKIKAICV